MERRCRKAGVALAATLASLGALRISSAAKLIEDDESAVVDGWNITAPDGVSLTVTSKGSEIFIEKAANFTEPNEGFQVAFQPVADATKVATSVDFTDETIQNNTGTSFSGFEFILMNIGSTDATFDGVSNVFAPPAGTGYKYTSVSLNAKQDILAYTGKQSSGSTSYWGSAADGDNLLIDTPSGADFSLKELSESGGGGGGGGGSPVPMPAAIWQSFAGLGMLGLFGLKRWTKNRRLA